MGKTTPWGFNGVGYLTYKRTYARKMKGGGTEEFPNTIKRVVDACRTQLGCGFSQEEEADLADILLNLEGSVAGRFWWQLGTETVDNLGLASLQNCAGVVVDHPVNPFTWAMDMLMLGSGVGYNIQRQYVSKLPVPKKANAIRMDNNQADYIVPDTREGWVKLLGRVLKSHFYSGESFTYSTHCIRSNGAAIKGFGGVASGPEILCEGMEKIDKLLNGMAGQKLRSIHALDIMNIIGSIVIAGNVRRSAQLAIGDYDDVEYLKAKRWDLGNVPNWRVMSNNSVACENTTMLPKEFWETYEAGGEPLGLINFPLTQTVGRLGETQYNDPGVRVFNPCVEQGLEDEETCCLAEAFLPNIKSEVRLKQVITMLYRVCKHSLLLPCHQPGTEAIVHKNMRMGIGMTGILQATKEQVGWLDEAYKYLRSFDESYSELIGVEPSIKLTTVKPSGTLSLLGGCTPGIHPGYSQYFIRRIRVASSSPLIQRCVDAGYKTEPVLALDGTPDHGTTVVEFPCELPENTIVASDLTAIQQLENVKWIQSVWSDNGVSCTVYYRKEELVGIKDWLATNYSDSLKACSFLLHSEHGFKQAPYEEIDKDTYETLMSGIEPITEFEVSEADMEIDECISGACPIK